MGLAGVYCVVMLSPDEREFVKQAALQQATADWLTAFEAWNVQMRPIYLAAPTFDYLFLKQLAIDPNSWLLVS